MRHTSVFGGEVHATDAARFAGGIVLAALCLAGAARARDIVQLRDGRYLEGEVTKQTDEAIWLKIGRGTLRLNRSEIRRIERAKPLPTWEALLRKKLREDREKRGKAARDSADKAQADKKAAVTEEEDRKAMGLVDDLASDDGETRKEAAALLELAGEKAVPALTKGLLHRSAFARESSARILGKVGGRGSVRAMIIALRSAVPEKAKIRPWQRSLVRALRANLVAVTKQDFGVSLYGTHQGKSAEKYVEWWDGEAPVGKTEGDDAKKSGPAPKKGACIEWDTPQVGEEPIPEDDPEREKKLYEARKIGGERHSYSAPKSFTDPFGEGSGR
jgi:hypothetical protein